MLNRLNKYTQIFFLSGALIGGSSFLQASTQTLTPEQRGLAIATMVEQRDAGWHDSSASLTMTLTNAQGEQSSRQLRLKLLEMQGDGDKGLTIFDSPGDVRGTGFLSYSHVLEADDQWLYLPALKRTKRIASNNKSGPFMGSQFSYEDISSFEVDKYRYTFLREDTLDAQAVLVMESVPKYAYSGYTRLVTWIDAKRFIPLKIEYYDRKNQLLKTQIYQDYQQYIGQYWRANVQTMENHNNHKVTRLDWSQYQFKVGLTEKDFNRAVLKRL
ncbi:MAG: outer membrane lipoprotein-sorting protein [Pseudomonadales bacterium]|nr:outer membrane lipoprotein-sorting protein [Pseudomonadales bacterium]